MEARIAVLEREIEQFDEYTRKMDSFSEKTTDVLVSIRELLAVHENILKTQEKTNKYLVDETKNTKDQLSEKMDEMASTLSDAIHHQAKKVSSLEAMKWVLTGAALLIFLILSKFGFTLPFIHL
jgi:dsDNA-specific endonuclease/ATPase MutS2